MTVSRRAQKVSYKKMTLPHLLVTFPFFVVILVFSWFMKIDVKLPDDWGVSHVVLIAVCWVLYITTVWFLCRSLWVTISHELGDDIVTTRSFLGFKSRRVRHRTDIKDVRIAPTPSRYGYHGYTLVIEFIDGTEELVCDRETIQEIQLLQRDLGLIIDETKQS